jgi:hypothetical protein
LGPEFVRVSQDLFVTMDEDDVPQLITLDEHISQQVDKRLSLEFDNGDGFQGKVPITILTGTNF